MNKKTYIINLIGGPGVGKSTIAALLFAELKVLGYVCEYVQEYAKKLVWLKKFDKLKDQYYVAKKQYDLFDKINNQVDFIITDGSLIHGIYYNSEYNKNILSQEEINNTNYYIIECINKFNNINIILDRVDRKYETEGRIQTEKQAKEIDIILKKIMNDNYYQYKTFNADISEIKNILKYVLDIYFYTEILKQII
jgi:shikimate kinase